KDRLLQGAGYRTLGDRTGQDPKTVKRNRLGLTRKFCIEPLGHNTFTEAAQFRICHFDTILADWRRRGLLWVRRAGRSVDLIPTGGISETPPGGISRPPTVAANETPTEGSLHTPPVGLSGPGIPLSSSSESNSSSVGAP